MGKRKHENEDSSATKKPRDDVRIYRDTNTPDVTEHIFFLLTAHVLFFSLFLPDKNRRQEQ